MTELLGRHLEVQTCIACGARHRVGECAEGCTEVPLDLVEAAELLPLQARRAGLEQRIGALRGVLDTFAEDWDAARAAGHEALTLPVPAATPRPAVVEAWGCPSCGRVDAPQPCLDVCIHRPVEMADAAEYDQLAAEVAGAEARERALTEVVRLIVHVRPREGAVQRTVSELQARADAVRNG